METTVVSAKSSSGAFSIPPWEITNHVFGYLSKEELFICQQVCKYFNFLIQNPALVNSVLEKELSGRNIKHIMPYVPLVSEQSRYFVSTQKAMTLLSNFRDGIYTSKTWRAHNEAISSMTFSGDHFFTLSQKGTVKMWDAQDCCQMEFRVPYKKVSCLEVSQDSIFTGFSDGTVQWWDLQGACLMTFGKNQQEIAFIQHRVGEGSCIFTGSVDGTIQKWDTQGTFIGQLNRLENKEEQQALVPIVDLVATGDHLFVGYKNGLLEIWDSSDDLLHSLKNAAGVLVDPKDPSLDLVTRAETLKKLRVSDSCTFMCFETSFEIWDLEKKTALSFPSHNGTILDVQLFEEHFFTAYSDGTIKLWKIDGKCERTFSFANNPQLSCAMFKNDLFFGFLNGQIKKYQFNSKKEDVLNEVAMELLSSKNNAARFLAMPQDIQNSVMQVLEKEANMSLWTYFSSILFSPEDALTGKVTKTFFACKEGLDSLYARYVKGIDPYQIQLAFAIKHSLK